MSRAALHNQKIGCIVQLSPRARLDRDGIESAPTPVAVIFYRNRNPRSMTPVACGLNLVPSAIRLLFGGDVSFDSGIWERGPIGVHRKRIEECGFFLRVRLRIMRAVRRRWHKILSRFQLTNKVLRRYQLIDLAMTDLQIKDSKNRLGDAADATCHRVGDPGKGSFPSSFARVEPLLKQMDFVSVNLETPLADDRARRFGLFRSDPGYAQVMADAGISLANLANNHIFDALEEGLSQTVLHLEKARIKYCGYGQNVEEARAGRTISIKGIRFAFLGYTHYCNCRYASIAGSYPGILPLDRQLVIEDIDNAKRNADFVFVNIHWGIEDQPYVQVKSVELAHEFIDIGADAIIGHHPHVPHGIEIYQGKPVLYSLGNFVFGYGSDLWGDNILVEIVIDKQRIQGLMIYPISGKGDEVRQPEVLTGTRGNAVLGNVARKSALFGTRIEIGNGVGYVAIASKKVSEKEEQF
jgi:poly-gamma-glutamate capsule biosynthesis protein CapA/YwtB (metallophosphatase superfamily)